MVGHCSASHPVTPWQGIVLRNVVEPAPHDEKGIIEEVGSVVARHTTTEITLERLVHLGCDTQESVVTLRFGAHECPMSAMRAILSPVVASTSPRRQRCPLL
jgi:hypothetical protein